MYITDCLIEFLHNSMLLSDSTIILTDLNKVAFVASNDDNYYYNYIDKNLDDSLKKFLYSSNFDNDNFFDIHVDNIIPIIEKENVSRYKSQIILPIVHNNIVDGLLIFVTDKKKYLDSNLKYAKTAKHFVEILTIED